MAVQDTVEFAIVGAGAGGDRRAISPRRHINLFEDFIRALRENRAPWSTAAREGAASPPCL